MVPPEVDICGRRLVILDFDGPVCRLFAGFDLFEACQTAGRSLRWLDEAPDDLFDVFAVAQGNAARWKQAHDAVTAIELQAVEKAPATAHISQLLASLRAQGTAIAVVTNNSADAVKRFADLRLPDLVGVPVFGRRGTTYPALKPAPDLLMEALSHFSVLGTQACFIGDSLSDVNSAKKAGIPCIAFANKRQKRLIFAATGAVVIDSLRELC